MLNSVDGNSVTTSADCAVGSFVGSEVGFDDSSPVGSTDGDLDEIDISGACDGLGDGGNVWAVLGLLDGSRVSDAVGEFEGYAVGDNDGEFDK